MRYDYREGVTLDKKRYPKIIWGAVGLILLGGIYWLANFMSPQLVSMPLSAKASPNATSVMMESTTPGEVHLYLPQINIDLPIGENSDDLSAGNAWLKNGADLTKEGIANICAVGFEMKISPWQTRNSSPFYNLGKLAANDEIYVDYQNTRYAYKITGVQQFEGDDSNLKSSSDNPELALFACKKDGSIEAGVLVLAEQVGRVLTDKDDDDAETESVWQPGL
ncbi:MAG: sortase [Candidatus Woesebacteria bacterium]|jgi:LPXTG-site transpeptidase (sortase) family protein